MVDGYLELSPSLWLVQADAYGRCYFMFVASARWLGFRLDFLCFLLLAGCTYLAVALSHEVRRQQLLQRQIDSGGLYWYYRIARAL